MPDLKMRVWLDDDSHHRGFVVGWDLNEVDPDTVRAEAHAVLDSDLDYQFNKINGGDGK